MSRELNSINSICLGIPLRACENSRCVGASCGGLHSVKNLSVCTAWRRRLALQAPTRWGLEWPPGR
jgi:hypothetical protein